MAHVTVRVSKPSGVEAAEVLVLGHSLGTSAALWREAAGILQERFRVVLWEVPGHGDAPPADGPFRMEDLTDALVARLDGLGIGRFHHAGISLGGCVGLDLAVRYPDRVPTSTVISAGAKVDAPDFWAERAAGVRTRGTGSIVEASRLRWFAPQTAAETAETVLDMLRRTDDMSYAYGAEALAAFDVSAELSTIAVPVLAVAGALDQAVPAERSKDIARQVQHGAYAEIANAAHSSPAEQPGDVAQTIDSFISAL